MDQQTGNRTIESDFVSDAIVVYVHGMWMPGEEMLFIKHHLEKHQGYAGHLFRYPSVSSSLDENAGRLADFVSALDAEQVHLVGHSLGGVLALRMLSLNPDAPAGRVVCMGSPLSGSRAADILHRTDWGSMILGQTISDGVVSEAANLWAGAVTDQRDVGSIAGTTPIGLGRLIAKFKEENDGTVAVSETHLAGLKDHICLSVSHSGMALSADTADQVAAFLKNGEFLKDD
jgi:pimeloyl-ACP methyl ester carboxylesterase